MPKTNQQQIESPYLSLQHAATLLGLTQTEMARTDALGRCAHFPELARIQHRKAVGGKRGSKILFVREQVLKVVERLQQPVIFEVASRPLDVDSATITEFLAMGKPGERALRQMGVRV